MLSFPTQAQQCLAQFNEAVSTVSIATLAKRMGAEAEQTATTRIYIFNDDTSLVVTGRGKSHSVQVTLP